MSRLDELIQELCPAGVELRKIKEVYTRLKGTPITAGKMKEIDNPNGDIKVFAGGKTVIKAFEEDIPRANIIRVPAVLVQSRGVIDAVYYEEPFTFKNEMWAYTADEKTSVKYLYYVLKNNIQQFRVAASGMGSMPQISLKVTEEFIIPVPPLPVQSEIVRILDNFTELTARKKQYEYYRKELLTFTDDVKKVPLIDVVKIKRGVRVVKSQLAVEGEYPVFQNSMTPLGYMDKANCTGDTAFIITAGAAGEIGYTDNDFWAADDCFSFECPQYLKSKYLYYILLCQKNTIYSKVRKASIPRLPRSAIEKLIIPVPNVDIQEKIVDVLDRFDTLCNDISKGLPAEIEARQKQYEYYRDKLLTFKESSDEN